MTRLAVGLEALDPLGLQAPFARDKELPQLSAAELFTIRNGLLNDILATTDCSDLSSLSNTPAGGDRIAVQTSRDVVHGRAPRARLFMVR
ncbi:MAG TPA: hypothetical protein VK993_08460 [Chthoniobacterales bacterium]|nr:hypothetical protein [Chthoniobacterales bacterium]